MIAIWPDPYDHGWTGSDLASNHYAPPLQYTDDEWEEFLWGLIREAHLKETREGALRTPVRQMNPRREADGPIPHLRTMVGRRRK